MGSINITSIKRRQFASSVVGTPGVDTGPAQALNSLASGSFQIGKVFQRNELITNKVQAAKEAQITEEEVQRTTAEIQAIYNADSSRDPAEGIRRIKENERTVRNRRLTEIDNRKVRGMTSLLHQGSSIRSANANNKWALKLQGINMLSNGTEVINGLATQAEQTPDFDVFQDLLQQGEQISKATAVGLDAKQGARFVKDSPESIATGYLNGRMKRDPEQGLEEFKNRGVFNTIFDSDERKKIETAFVKAIQGKDALTNYTSAKSLANTFGETVANPALLDDVTWLTDKKNELEEKGELTSQREFAFNNQIDSVLKNNKLNATRDPQTVIDLSVEFSKFGIGKSGVVKEDIANFNDVFDFMLRLSQARSDGKIDDSTYNELAIPLQIAVENASASKEAEGGFSLGGAVESVTQAAFFGDFSGGWGFQKNPTNFGITEIDKYLETLELGETKLKNVRGSMLSDLFLSIERDRNTGVSITNDSIRNNLTEIIKENGARFDIPVFLENEGPLRHNSATNQIEQQQLDGSWKAVK